MYQKKHIAMILMAGGIAACGGASSKASADSSGSTGVEQETKRMQAPEFLDAAKKAALVSGYEVAEAKSNGSVAAIILYRPKNTDVASSHCVLSVVEATTEGIKVIGSSKGIIECPLETSPADVKAKSNLLVESKKITLRREAARGNGMFLLEKSDTGSWYVTKVTYTRTQEDAATGDMVVVEEEAAYPSVSEAVPLDRYSHAEVERDLVTKIVE